MRKLNGITINGEHLGNRVVINGMFRAICTISPIIMHEFVKIINKIKKLDGSAVKINNFNCGLNSIDIEFENLTSKGTTSLCFKLTNGEPELTDIKLIIDNQKYEIPDEHTNLPEANSAAKKEKQYARNEYAASLSQGLTAELVEELTQWMSKGYSQSFTNAFNISAGRSSFSIYDNRNKINNNSYKKMESRQEQQIQNQNKSEVNALKAELKALKAKISTNNNVTMPNEFIKKQKQQEISIEKQQKQKFKIIGSKERIYANALKNDIYVAGNKVYKWGNTLTLDK